MAKELAVLLCLIGIVLAIDENKSSPVNHNTPKKLSISFSTTAPPADVKPNYNNQEVNSDQESRKLSNTLVTDTDPRNSIEREPTGYVAEKKTIEEAQQQETTRPPTADYVYGLFVPYATQPHQQYGSAQVGHSQALHKPEQVVHEPLNIQLVPFDFAPSSLVPQPQLAPFHLLGPAPYHPNLENVLNSNSIVTPQSPYPEAAHQSITSHLPRTPLPHVVPYPLVSYPPYHHLQGAVNSPRDNYVSTPITQIGNHPVQFTSNPIRSPRTLPVESRPAARIPFLVAPSSNQHNIITDRYRPEFKYVYAPIQHFKSSLESRAAIEGHQTSSTPSPDYAVSTLGPLPHLAHVQHLETATYRPSEQFILRTPLPHVVPSSEVSYPVNHPIQRVFNGPKDNHGSTSIAQTGHRSVQVVSSNIESPDIVDVKVPTAAHYALSVTPSPVQHIKSDVYRPELQYLTAPISKSKQYFDSRAAVNEDHQSINAQLLPPGKVQTQYVTLPAAPKLNPYIYSAAESQSQNFIAETKQTSISDYQEIPVQAVYQNSESRNPERGLYSKARKFSLASDVSSVRYKGTGLSYEW